ncbi:hypothetical protein [uncultured Tenacibaculum sp.]|uniref:hypothetical protein n=1 Tax=uncultured Tenacibaculum sp. TaxID=174713 RepID=UPI0026276C4A|nr:hypothetical protein [uncultured Tenacibaculum sp.]
MNRANQMNEYELEELKYQQKIISSLSNKLGILDITAGKKVIRNNKNFRTNEKDIEYSWLVNITHSLIESCWIFSIKFKESNFRDIKNSEELIQGIFTVNKDGAMNEFYLESRSEDFQDRVKNFTEYDMFEANPGFALDGVRYKYLIFAPNTQIKISLNNPNSEKWKQWEHEIKNMGLYLIEKSKLTYLKSIFPYIGKNLKFPHKTVATFILNISKHLKLSDEKNLKIHFGYLWY